VNGTLTRLEGPAAAVRGGGASYLARLLDVLETIGEHDGITLTDLAREASVPLSTASRLTALLVERRFVERVPPSGLLLPGPQLERIGLRAVRRLRELDRFDAAVTRLASTTGESVSVGLVIMNEIVLVARKESDHPLRMVVRVGDAVTPLGSAMGKAILSRLAPDRRRELVAGAGCGDVDAALATFAAELDEASTVGYALDEEAYAVGLRCVASAFLDAQGRPAGAISVAGPTARFTVELRNRAIPQLAEETRTISRHLGYGD
jgi:DNA-binding IclR family transcriptional regulator